ncbi:MAG: B12-binding domain-containing radical SAM protein [Terriglobales bacterium]
MSGKRIVLAASPSESCEYQRSTWRQMLLATLPAKYWHRISDVSIQNEVLPDGQAKYVPHGLRVVEALLLERFRADDIAVCFPDQFDRFIGDDTRVVGLHAHNPMGIAFAADLYSHFWGRDCESVNAAEFRRMIEHPILRRHHPHLRLIVGGPGTWQIARKGMQDPWAIDCLVDGEAEGCAADLFAAAVHGQPLPRSVQGHSPGPNGIPNVRHRSTFGAVEITRGCGRGCQFCSIALRHGASVPLEHILADVRRQVAEGADTIMLITEDLFLYEQGRRFQTNIPALTRLFHAIGSEPGVKYVVVSHGTMAPVVHTPEVIDALTPVAVGQSWNQHPLSTHPDHRYAMLFIGLETGSPRLFEQYMKGKSYPFKPSQWPEVVLKGMDILNRRNWFPFCTWIVGLPGETDADMKQSLDLLFCLKDFKFAAIPTVFVPLEQTRLAQQKAAKLVELTDLQWEFFFTCWRYSLDLFRWRATDIGWKYAVGIPIYYSLLGRRLFGRSMKYGLFRVGHYPERWLRRHLYLDFTGGMRPRYQVPEHIAVPAHAARPAIPEDEAAREAA